MEIHCFKCEQTFSNLGDYQMHRSSGECEEITRDRPRGEFKWGWKSEVKEGVGRRPNAS